MRSEAEESGKRCPGYGVLHIAAVWPGKKAPLALLPVSDNPALRGAANRSCNVRGRCSFAMRHRDWPDGSATPRM